MFFTKTIYAHKITYKICGIKFTFSKKLSSKAKQAGKKKKLEYKLKKFFHHTQNVKKYKYIIPFGSNCDFSIKFLEYYRFSDSTFWNWVWAMDVDQQIRVFKSPEILFSNGRQYIKNGGGMWLCPDTKLCFHGKHFYNEMLNDDGTFNNQKLEEEFEELISRTKYLYKKTKRYMSSPDKKLFEYTLLCSDYKNLEKYIDKIKKLYEFLKSESTNFDFLIITAHQNYSKVKKAFEKSYPEVYIRAVKSVWENKGQGLLRDETGWLNIFKEFQPEKIQKSKFKTIKYHQLEVNKLN